MNQTTREGRALPDNEYDTINGRLSWPWNRAEHLFVQVYGLHARKMMKQGTLSRLNPVVRELARRLGRSYHSIYGRMTFNNLPQEYRKTYAEIEERLLTQDPIPLPEGYTYLYGLMWEVLEARRKTMQYLTEHPGASPLAAQFAVGADLTAKEVDFDLDRLFNGQTWPSQPEGRDRFSPTIAPEKAKTRGLILEVAKRELYEPRSLFDLPGENGYSSKLFKDTFPEAKIYAAEHDEDIAVAIEHKIQSKELPIEALYTMTAREAFERHAALDRRPFDLVNLDFCGKWTPEVIASIEALFRFALLAHNGLLVLTHLAVRDERKSVGDVLGFSVGLPSIGQLRWTSRVFDRDEIRLLHSKLIEAKAAQYRYNIHPVMEPFEYADDTRSPMSVYIYRAEYPADERACQSKANLLEFEWAEMMVSPNKRGEFIKHLAGEHVRALEESEREEFNEQIVNILMDAEREDEQ